MHINPNNKQGRQRQCPTQGTLVDPAEQPQQQHQTEAGKYLRARSETEGDFHDRNGGDRPGDGRSRPSERFCAEAQGKEEGHETDAELHQKKPHSAGQQMGCPQDQVGAVFVIDERLAVSSPRV